MSKIRDLTRFFALAPALTIFLFLTSFIFVTLLSFHSVGHAYTLPDTGQTKCYDNTQEIPCPQQGEPFYGQDGNYQGEQMSYRDNGDGTVTDLNTGLIWQQGDDQNNVSRTWQQSLDYCAGLDLAGHSDWRLPTRMELLSILDYGIPWPGPTINTSYFPNCRSDGYWSSSELYVPTSAWAGDFVGGGAGWSWKTGNYSVRCVRGETIPNSVYVDNHDGTVSDTLTGLTWQQGDDQNNQGGRSWQDALAYCEGLNLAGRGDWRLPNISELQALVDESRDYPAIDPLFQCRWLYFWSGSTFAVGDDPYGPYRALAVVFTSGGVNWGGKTYGYSVRCVRGGPSGPFGPLTPFSFTELSSPQNVGVPFATTITARRADGSTDTGFNGEVFLNATIGAVAPMWVTLTNGSAAVSNLVLDSAGYGVKLVASGQGKSGESNAFDVNGSGANTASVAGSVKDGSGNGMPNAVVYLRGQQASDEMEADTDGNYQLSNLPAGEYAIKAVTGSGRSSREYPVQLQDHTCLPMDLVVGSSCNPSGLIPVLLVPGFPGSSVGWGPYPILPKKAPKWDEPWNNGSWGLHDPDKAVGWRDLIDALHDADPRYERDCTVFPVPYDWRMNLDDAAHEYLVPWIKEAKNKAGSDKVHVIAHSMGGLVTRAYIQSGDYQYNIDRFAMVGTPNHGAATPYYLWEGGDPVTADAVPVKFDVPGWILNFYENTANLLFLNYYYFPPGPHSVSDGLYHLQIHSMINHHCQSAKQVMPTFEFLNSSRGLDCEKNQWLIDLNNSNTKDRMGRANDTNGKVRTMIFAGKGQKTLSNITVGPKICWSPVFYKDGDPLSRFLTDSPKSGDGTVLTDSASLGDLVDYTEHDGEHYELIKEYKKELVEFVTGVSVAARRASQVKAEASAGTKVLTISIIGRAQPYLVDPLGRKSGINPGTLLRENGIDECTLASNGSGIDVSITNAVDGEYILTLKDGYTEDYQLRLSYMDGERNVEKLAWGFSHADTVSFPLNLDSGSEEPLSVQRRPIAPAGLQADALEAGGLKTRLCWEASTEDGLIGYSIYARDEDQPTLAQVGTSTQHCYDTGDVWAESSVIKTRVYAVSAVKTDGSESFLSNLVKNNDRDHDGLTDEEEVTYGTDPANPDTDGDGLSDAEEYIHGTNPLLVDTDGDGYTDLQEVQAGSDPLDPTSIPTPIITSFAINNGDPSTRSTSVILNNSIIASTPTHYMASESSSFTGATWQTYSTAPSFTLSSGHGTKTVYFKVKNGSGTESGVLSDNISLVEPALAANFGPQGLWLFRNAAWSQLTDVSPNRMASYGNKLAGNFSGYGLYQYDGAAWTQLTSNSSVEDLVGISNGFYADYASLGVWVYNGAWAQITGANPSMMQANGNNLLANFPGYGLYQYDGTTWTELTSNDTVESMLGISGKVYADYGSLGLWKYDGTWKQMTWANPDKMQAYNGKLAANFPDYGLYEYDGTTWTQLSSNDSVQDLIGVSSTLFADYGTLGLWKYDGTWTQITPTDADRMGYYGEKLVGNFTEYGLYEYNGSSWACLTGNSGATDMIGVDLP